MLLRFDGTGFEPIADSGLDKPAGEATFGMALIDVTGDGLSDLFIARSGGLHFHRNLGAGAATRFAGERIAFSLDDNTSPLAITLADIDHDGAIDLHVAGYIRQDRVQGETILNQRNGGYSYLLHNNGDNTFTDIAAAAGLRRQHNTFMAVFADMDNDGYQDLLIAQNHARFPGVKTLRLYRGHFLRQVEPGRFAAAEESAGLHNANFGIAPLVSDFNGDGWPDVLFANLTQPARAFVSYLAIPAIGVYLLPSAMNVAHFAFFSLSCLVLARTSG